MANSSSLLGTLNMRVGGRGNVYVMKSTIDSADDHIVFTPGDRLVDATGKEVGLGTLEDSWWLVGCQTMDAVAKTLTIKSGAVAYPPINLPAGGGIGKELQLNGLWLGGMFPGSPFVVNLSTNASPTTILWHFVVAKSFGV
jgi:hypothetical protein